MLSFLCPRIHFLTRPRGGRGHQLELGFFSSVSLEVGAKTPQGGRGFETSSGARYRPVVRAALVRLGVSASRRSGTVLWSWSLSNDLVTIETEW